jgi:hypothetical protein
MKNFKMVLVAIFFTLGIFSALPVMAGTTYNNFGRVRSGGSWHYSWDFDTGTSCGSYCIHYDMNLAAYCDDVDAIEVDVYSYPGYNHFDADVSRNGSTFVDNENTASGIDYCDDNPHGDCNDNPWAGTASAYNNYWFENTDMCDDMDIVNIFYKYTNGNGTLHTRRYSLSN